MVYVHFLGRLMKNSKVNTVELQVVAKLLSMVMVNSLLMFWGRIMKNSRVNTSWSPNCYTIVEYSF